MGENIKYYFGILAVAIFLVMGCTSKEIDNQPIPTYSCPDGTIVINLSACPKCPSICDDGNASTIDWCGINSTYKCVHDVLVNTTHFEANITDIIENNTSNNSTKNEIQNTSKINNNTIKIANWNLQIFGDAKENNSTLMGIYARVIGQYNIVFIQEIRDADQSAFTKLCGLLPEYNCNISSRAGRTTSKEQVGIIYRKGITIISWKDFNPDALDRWERPPIAVGFDINGYSVTAYNIHIDPNTVSSELDALEQIVTNSGNVIVLGDFNADCLYYTPQEETDFDDWNWVIKDSDDTTVSLTDCAYDRIILNSDAYAEFVQSGIFHQGIEKAVSDHYPVWVEIKTNETTLGKEMNTIQIDTNSSANTVQNMTDKNINPTICEIVYDPPGKEPDEEMIQICNSGSNPITIAGWIISDGEGDYTVPRGTILQSGGMWQIFGATYNPNGSTKALYLANSGDCVTLFDSNMNEIDKKCW
jgi:endonuclease/exonuclease/phosphatase family metal-dependent hydrolase